MRSVKIRVKLFNRENSKLAKASVSSDRAEKNHSVIADIALRDLRGISKNFAWVSKKDFFFNSPLVFRHSYQIVVLYCITSHLTELINM